VETLVHNFFNLEIMVQAWPLLLRGFWMTLLLCAVVIPIGLAGGLGLSLLSRSPVRGIRWLTIVYVDLFRALPPLVLLIFIAAGLPFAGVELPAIASVAIAFLLNTSSYYGEIFRAGIEAVPRGQREAARSTGLGAAQAMVFVVLPQAVRNVVPDLLSNTLEVAKLTSIASVVAFQELLYTADMARSVTYNASPLVMAAGFYLVLLWPLVRLLSLAERRLASR
jgi:polar amino acid transport system permease protein